VLHTVVQEAARMDQLLTASGLGDVLFDTAGMSIAEAAAAIARESHLGI
jgi:hypothetical protein